MAIDFQTLQFAFVFLGYSLSLMVFLAPLPTFYKIYKKKSSEGFECLPYVVSLLSAMLWIYYAFLYKGEILLVFVNSVGCVFEAAYVAVFLCYAAPDVKRQIMRTKNTEFMPILLSIFLTLSADIWLFYGLIFDYEIILPNFLGLMFGVIQMAIYMMYMVLEVETILEQLDEERKKCFAWMIFLNNNVAFYRGYYKHNS